MIERMDREWFELRFAHTVIAVTVAIFGSILTTLFAVALRGWLLGYPPHPVGHLHHPVPLRPADLGFALAVFWMAWFFLFRKMMRVQHVKAWKQAVAEIAEEEKERFSITGRPLR
jgi:hypothetical protein